MFAPLLALFLCLGARILAASPPDENPKYILEPLNSTEHGLIFSQDRIVLKVDCPGCPVYDTSWDTEATALIFDFTVSIDHDDPKDWGKPALLLNNDSCFPENRELGWTGFTDHTARPVPWTVTFEDYIAQPDAYSTADLVGVVQPLAVNNTYGWNLTAVLFLTVAYGSGDRDTFENFEGNVSAVEIFFRTTSVLVEWKDAEGEMVQERREQWSLEWWQIVPFTLLYNKTVSTNPPSVEIPDGLTYKLLGYVPKEEYCHTGCNELRPKVDDLLGWVHFLGAIVVITLVVGVGAVVWWYFGQQIMKLKVWENLQQWWKERVQKRQADGGENAPLLAGGQDED